MCQSALSIPRLNTSSRPSEFSVTDTEWVSAAAAFVTTTSACVNAMRE
ncbi:hypothetical protein NK6_4531 [Bradyrhizobium diazoefficiens]|uniref:Uncharacterized protein n=1 Tax=Bradyrhizobium diazoefficiens TaxID=1355477 RepID=A0A0E4BQM0_9BRAD|nr:hypothetical protein NK6_4531 [Bradyrhizobium diazoefficiens]